MFGNHLIWTLAILFSIPHVLAKESATKKDLEQMQGTWRLARVEMRQGEGPFPESILKECRLIIRKSTWTITNAVVKEVKPAPFSIDPTKTPKWIDLSFTAKFVRIGESKDRVETIVINGVYEIKGDTLRICHWHFLLTATFPPKRPTEMKPATDVWVFVWERVKDK